MDKDKKIMEQCLDFKKIKKGTILKGEVISSNSEEVIVNINYFCDGIIKKEELIGGEYPKGALIDVYVISLDDGDGNIVLSEKKANNINATNELKEVFNKGNKVIVRVNDKVDAGLICDYKGIRGFIPKSRISTKKVNLDEYLNKDVEVILIELDLSKNKIVFSRKELEIEEEEKRRIDFINSVNVGDKFVGIVKSVKDFGAFIEVCGIQGFIHKSEITHKHNFNIYDILKVSDKVNVSILSIDKDNNKISLSMKECNYNPYQEYKNEFVEGNVYDVSVMKIVSSGLIVSLNDYLTGFIHVSEVSDDSVNLNKEFKIGDVIKAKVISISEEDKKISLSYKQVFEEESSSGYTDEDTSNSTLGDVFKDLFSKLK